MPHGPTSAWTFDGRPKMPAPMMPLIITATIGQRPMPRIRPGSPRSGAAGACERGAATPRSSAAAGSPATRGGAGLSGAGRVLRCRHDVEPRACMMKRPRLALVLQLVASIVLLALVVRQVPLEQSRAALTRIRAGTVAGACALALIGY